MGVSHCCDLVFIVLIGFMPVVPLENASGEDLVRDGFYKQWLSDEKPIVTKRWLLWRVNSPQCSGLVSGSRGLNR